MPRTPRPIPVSELAAFLEVAWEGEAGPEIGGFASLAGAMSDELVFVRDAGQVGGLEASQAAAALVPPGLEVGALPVLRSPRPANDFSRLIEHFAPRPRPPSGLEAGAHVAPTAEVDPTAAVAAGAFVGPDCRVGPRTVLAPGVVLVADVVVGEDGWFHAGAILREGTRVGNRVVLQPGVVLGADGFGYVPDADGRPVAMAQRGGVVVEDDVEIGANTTVDRATLDVTRIRRGAKIDNGVQIAHNCDVGEDVLIVSQTGLAGGTLVGDRAILMARSASAGHLRIGAGAFLAANTAVHHDVPAGARMYGVPAQEEHGWHRTVAALKRLPDLLKRVRRLERAQSTGSEDEGTGA